MRYRTIAAAGAGLALTLAAGGVANAQEVSVPSVTVANPGGYANPLKLDTDRYDREQRAKQNSRNGVPTRTSAACSADALPAAERRHLEIEYVQRARADGKASADAWVREQGKRYRLKLIAQGICPDPQRRTQTARRDQSNSDGEGCQMTMQPVAGLGGAPMTMAMVPDCGDDD
ncbi:hypothetical protein ACBY01_15665 [Sphingomonas sp. ac-8]|uniref:hypothetical protein n=1 Tax=Sphingomonas sp. ac-8 TaxID=3242977 RepID=UPI003A7FCA19